MREIKLSQGQVALVDDADFDMVSKHKWYATKSAFGYRASTHLTRKLKCQLHRFIMNPPSDMCVHHANGDPLDNRRDNLVVCTKAENNRGFRRKSLGKSSRYRVVCWSKEKLKWKAYIEFDGRLKNIGMYATEEAAAAAYNGWASLVFGEFAHLNAV